MGAGEALGYNYKIPQSFIGSQQPIQQDQQQGVEPPSIDTPVGKGDYLAHVEGLTDKYYETAGLLKAFTHDQAKKGIDVTEPDYSQPGGGELFKTYQKLSAVLTHTANDLANSNDINKTMMKLQAEGRITQNPEFDPTQQSSARMNPSDMFTSTNLDPATQAAAQDLSQTYYTQRDANAKNQAVRNPLIDFYQKRIQEDPKNARYYEQQIAALHPATSQTAYQQLVSGNKSPGKIPPGISVLKKVVNLSSGVWNDGTYKPVIKSGKVFLENKEMAGESIGQYATYDSKGMTVYKPKIIKSWLKDPDTGEVKIEYQDSEVPDDVVSSQPGAIATNFIANNPKYGDVAKTMDVANSLGLVDDTGSVIPEYLTPQNAEEIKAKVRGTGKSAAESVKARVSKNIEQLSKIEDPGFWKIGGNSSVEFTLPDGRKIEVKKHRGEKKFYIPDAGNYFNNPLGQPAKDEEYENMSIDDVISDLSSLGLYDTNLNTKDNTEVPKTKAEFDAKWAALKSGEKLVGLDGKTYTKK